jgi:hypothetical protein
MGMAVLERIQRDTHPDLAVDAIYPRLAKNNVRQAKTFRLRANDGWKLSDDIKLERNAWARPGAGAGSPSAPGRIGPQVSGLASV